MSFLSSYLSYTQGFESPSSFWKWSGYSTLAAVLKDNIYQKRGESRLYPNIYVLILAQSSTDRKGYPLDLAEVMLHKINNTKIISGSASIQALIDELARVESDATTGKVKKSGAGVFLAQEFSAALVEDPRAIKILTDIYDYKPMGYNIRLISRANAKIENLVLSMFAASNDVLLKGLFTDAAVYGGLLARTFLVVPNEFRPSNSLWEQPDSKLFDKTVSALREVEALRGEVTFEDSAKDAFDRWYMPFRDSYKKLQDKSGVVGRIHTSIIKLAMILAANDLTICVKAVHMEEAITEAMALMPNYRAFLMSTGASRSKEDLGAFVLETLLKADGHCMSRKTFLQQPMFIQPEGAELLDKMMVSLELAGFVLQRVNPKNPSDGSYILTSEALERLLGQKKGGA